MKTWKSRILVILGFTLFLSTACVGAILLSTHGKIYDSNGLFGGRIPWKELIVVVVGSLLVSLWLDRQANEAAKESERKRTISEELLKHRQYIRQLVMHVLYREGDYAFQAYMDIDDLEEEDTNLALDIYLELTQDAEKIENLQRLRSTGRWNEKKANRFLSDLITENLVRRGIIEKVTTRKKKS